MTVVNHAAAGAVIALVIKQPYLAVLLAFLSHFAMDGLPHFGYSGYSEALKHRLTHLYIFLDLVGWFFLIWAMSGLPWLPYIAAFAAVLPDILQSSYRATYYFWLEKRGKHFHRGPLSKFHRWIQWGHYPWGILIEIAVAVLLISLVWKLK
ncbi:hypothetical protein HYW35_01975 [Candidatus Saccharibacteria bacterium]|nr:hypothetical protein [Candidatus Saccharibacteria bacterium]